MSLHSIPHEFIRGLFYSWAILIVGYFNRGLFNRGLNTP